MISLVLHNSLWKACVLPNRGLEHGNKPTLYTQCLSWISLSHLEEMFSSNQGLWWSPGGKRVAYAQFNDTEVHTIEYTWYGEDQYPSTVSIAYPKVGCHRIVACGFTLVAIVITISHSFPVQPGTPNPVAKLFVVDTDNVTLITEVVVPPSFGSR